MCREPKSKHALIQKIQKLNIKNKFFLTESKERHQNSKRTEISVYERGFSLLKAPLFTLKFFIVLKVELGQIAKL